MITEPLFPLRTTRPYPWGLSNLIVRRRRTSVLCNSTENSFINYDYNFDGTAEDVLAGVNLWAGLTTNNYDGYMNIYDPVNNPLGPSYNTTVFQNPAPASNWNAAQVAYNLTLPKIVLTNAQFGAVINFQLCLREYSLGIHNTKYVRTLLTNSIAALP